MSIDTAIKELKAFEERERKRKEKEAERNEKIDELRNIFDAKGYSGNIWIYKKA